MSRKKKSTNGAKGRRYSEQERAAVLEYVEKTDAERGRGGITAAAKKFGITPLTISNWRNKHGHGTGRSMRRSANFTTALRKMADLHESIAKVEAELIGLKKEYGKIKATL